MSARHVISVVLLFAGVGIELLCCVGVVLMRNTFDRLHFVGPAAFSALTIAVAIVVKESFSLLADKALATAVVLLISSPVLAHVTARGLRTRLFGDWKVQRGEEIEVEER